MPSFESIGFLVQEKKRKINFQDGSYFRFLIGKILAIFDLQVTLMLPTRFRELAQGCRRSRLLKQLLMPEDGHLLTTIAHHEHFVLR